MRPTSFKLRSRVAVKERPKENLQERYKDDKTHETALKEIRNDKLQSQQKYQPWKKANNAKASDTEAKLSLPRTVRELKGVKHGKLISRELGLGLYRNEDGELEVSPKDDPGYHKAYAELMGPLGNSLEERRQALLSEETDIRQFFSQPGATKDVQSFNWLIRAQGLQHKLDLAFQSFKTMEEWGIEPDTHTYTALISACAVCKDAERAKEVAIQMKKESELKPNIWTYAALLNAYVNSGDSIAALRLLKLMERRGPKPDQVAYSTVIKGLIKERYMEQAWDVYYRARAELGQDDPDEVLITTMINAAAEEGETEKAFSVFNEMEIMAMFPTEVTFNALIKACSHRPEMLDKAFETATKMRLNGFKLNLYSYNSLLRGCALAQNVPRAKEVLETMNQNGVVPNEFTYQNMLACYAHCMQKDFEKQNTYIAEAEVLFKRMSSNNLNISVVTLNCMLNVYTSALRLNRAQAFFDTQYKARGIQQDATTYKHLIEMYAGSRRLLEAESLFKQMQQEGITPKYGTYRALFMNLARTGMKDQAIEYIEMARKELGSISAFDFRQFQAAISGSWEKRKDRLMMQKAIRDDLDRVLDDL
eukprot:gb/GECH01008484.1/.p1 GENE.gb/GECH01008484.1/~~gb/GECH01008484.1/.p1  ORF type:complete len:592 (+),score=157.34 gb/GECH01008484.1/:1-1776(+)